MKYVDVILPLPLSATYTYELPPSFQGAPAIGCRVLVPFGQKKVYTAVVVALHDNRPENYEVKQVLEVLDSKPVLLPVQLDFWRWIAQYYICSPGEIFKAALPSGMKLESESVLLLNPDYDGEDGLSDDERKVVSLFAHEQEQSLSKIQKQCAAFAALRVVKGLLAKGVLVMKEEVKQTFKPRTETHIRLCEKFFDENILSALLDELKRAPKQLAVLTKYIEMSGCVAALRLKNSQLLEEVPKRSLMEAAGVTTNICNALIVRGVFESYQYEIGRLSTTGVADVVGLSPLSNGQQQAFNQISSCFRNQSVCLLHGVTSSGKTEVYIHLIRKMIDEGKQVLYLVPEIALTTQLTERLSRVFGGRMVVYHSKFPDAERVEIWNKQMSDSPYDVVLGARSSVFLPFQRLGLVIVDEEHEHSYKQQDPSPRYHARNAALVLAKMCGAKTLLGTATPALETYYNVRTNKYGLVEMKERYGHVEMPCVEVVDIKELHRKRRMVGPFSSRLLDEMRRALENKEQVILFQNRRGYAPQLECHACGWTPRCPKCDVSMTYHKSMNKLTCHYCGFVSDVPARCPACEEKKLVQHGFGTEKVEDVVKHLFPDASIARMDLDTTRTRSAYERIISDFQEGRTNILIGTQMVTKGLDFERVGVVGILNADSMMNVPDFRSFERAYQMMAQVAGRAGRRRAQGRVILQTKSPDLPVIAQVVSHDYNGLYCQQIEERQLFAFPPFCRLIYVYMKHKRSDVLDRLAKDMGQSLRAVFGHRILGPDVPPVARIQLLYIRKIVIKLEPGISMDKVRQCLLSVRDTLLQRTGYGSAQIYYDVDPM